MKNKKREDQTGWNEFEKDFARAPMRSGQIPAGAFRGKTVAVLGEREELSRALAWSFEAWEEQKDCGPQSVWTGAYSDLPELADSDYLILTGFCCAALPQTAADVRAALGQWEQVLDTALAKGKGRVLLLSDGRVFGELPPAFAASEYEMGKIIPGKTSDAIFLQCAEQLFVAEARKRGISFNLLRLGELYGPCLVPGSDTDNREESVHRARSGKTTRDLLGCGDLWQAGSLQSLARRTAAGIETELALDAAEGSYICIHDALTAVQFVLAVCPENKILHAAGKDSNVSVGQIVLLLHKNFPELCKISLSARKTEEAGTFSVQETCGSALLNTQLIESYGFEPQVSLEDGLIMLVKSLQKKEEIFIFDHTYMGKLDTVHEILLGYLLEIDRICTKHHIRYFLAGGTLLGAIRHHGFIPWDDDADVMMLREDFDRFMEVARQELPPNVFVQTSRTERINHNAFTKLRIDDTLFATEFTGRFPDMHNGIFFDVLAHDRTGNSRWTQKLHRMATMISRSIVFNKWGNTDIKSGGAHPLLCKIGSRVKNLVPMPLAEWAQEKMYRFYQNKNTDYLYDGMGRNLKRGAFPRAWLQESVRVEFEGHLFPVPAEYEKYLTWLYGDYMEMIPVSARRVSHSIVLTDLGEYSRYLSPAPQGGEFWKESSYAVRDNAGL